MATPTFPDIVLGAMSFDREIHHRRSIRLTTWDYRERGAYFVTICTHERVSLFKDERFAAIAAAVWHAVIGDGVGEFVVMPNHVHGVAWIVREPPGRAASTVGVEQLRTWTPYVDLTYEESLSSTVAVAHPLRHGLRDGLEPGSLPVKVRTFKSASAKRINRIRNTTGAPVWQRGYYDRVIRDDLELEAVREYILDNPRRWAEDPNNPARLP